MSQLYLVVVLACVSLARAITFRDGLGNTVPSSALQPPAAPVVSASEVENVYITSTSPRTGSLDFAHLFGEPQPSAADEVYITSTTPKPSPFEGFGSAEDPTAERSSLFRQEALGTVVGAPPEVLKLYSAQDGGEGLQSNPSRYHPIHYKASPYLGSPVSDFFGSGLSSGDNTRKIQQITSQSKPYTKKGAKSAYKKPRYPKKYTSSFKKLNKIKIRPVEELNEFDNPDSLKPKRKIPLSLYRESASLENPFSEDLVSFHKSSGLEQSADFSGPAGGHGERVEFQMYGMDGPHSYKFGYDTGKGHNRHFRFEERDNHGKVRGQYGFYDKDGTMRIMKYEADPHTGFHAGPYDHPENDFF